jgi:hypothetical protein
MSIQDERELRDRLGGLLHGIEPGLAPVAGTMRRGKGIRMRRWISAAAGVAVIAAGAVVLPGLLRAHPSGPAAPPRHYKVSVMPIGAGTHPGLIGQGTTDGHRWTAIMSAAGRDSVMLTGRGLASVSTYESAAAEFAANPAALMATGSSGPVLEFGTVRADVTDVVLTLPDGEVISLAPVSWHGRRWVAVQLPPSVPIVRATLYTRRGELAYAVPFHDAELATWWQPGQVGPARLTKSIGSGVVDGKPWHASADIGPWGYCYSFGYSFGPSPTCFDSTVNPVVVPAGTLVSPMTCSAGSGQPAAGFAASAAAVRRVVLKYAGGSSAVFPTFAVGSRRMFGYAISVHHKVVGSLEYGAAGQLLGTTPGALWAC